MGHISNVASCSRKGGHSSGTAAAAAAAGCVEWEWVAGRVEVTGGGVIEKQGNTRLTAVARSLAWLEAFAVWHVPNVSAATTAAVNCVCVCLNCFIFGVLRQIS